MKFYGVFLCIVWWVVPSVKAVLDGRTSPVFVDGGYTFTDYAWARGEVYFRNGFTVPPNVTAILGITPPVRGTITLCDSGDATTPSTIMLESPLDIREATLNGGCTFRTSDGSEGKIFGFNGYGDRFIFNNDMRLDMCGRTVQTNLVTGGPHGAAGFTFNNTSNPVKLTLANGTLFTLNDQTGLVFFAGPTVGRHQLILENVGMVLSQSAQLTFTNLDVTCSSGSAIFSGPDGYANSLINFYSTLKIDDDALLTALPGLQFNLTSSIVSNDYFQIAPRGKIALNSNKIAFNRALHLPFPTPNKNTYAKIVMDGASTLEGTGLGSSNNTVYLGAGPVATYTCDAALEIATNAKTVLNNVVMKNRNFLI